MTHVDAEEDDQNELRFPVSNPGGTSKQSASYDVLKELSSREANSIARNSREENLSFDEIESLKAQEAVLRLKAERAAFDSYHNLRQRWASVLRNLLYGMVGFEAILTFSVGLGWLHFPSQLFLNLIVGQTFLQIVGMCYIVVRFLFPNDKNPLGNPKTKKTTKAE